MAASRSDRESMDATSARLQGVFRTVLDLPADCDVTLIRQDSEPRWDSLSHVSLVVAIESELGVAIDAADALRMTSYEEARRVLEEMGL